MNRNNNNNKCYQYYQSKYMHMNVKTCRIRPACMLNGPIYPKSLCNIPDTNPESRLETNSFTATIMAAVATRICESSGCDQPAKLQCPTCIKLGIHGSFFCAQVCSFVCL